MATVPGGAGAKTPAAIDLLARWRERFRAADYDALTELYHHEGSLVGGTPVVHAGRDQIHEYFASLGPIPDADVTFAEVTSRLIRPDVLIVVARAEFSLGGKSLLMRLTQVWVDDWAGWLIASHHASPIADIR